MQDLRNRDLASAKANAKALILDAKTKLRSCVSRKLLGVESAVNVDCVIESIAAITTDVTNIILDFDGKNYIGLA